MTKSLSKTRENWQFDVLMECQSVIDGTRTKILCFKNHETIEDTLVKLKVIYNPVKCFAHQFIPGYDPMDESMK